MKLQRTAISLMALLAAGLAPLSAAANNWVKLGETAEVTLYIDQGTMKQLSETTFQAMEMQDLKKPDADGVRSRRYIGEYDCKYRMHRIGKIASFEGPRLTGKQLFDVSEFGYWRKVPPQGLFALGFVVHCAK